MSSDIPDEYICPISYELMTDPMILGGHSYQRGPILKWLEKNNTSPMTNQAVDPSTLMPNYALKSAVERWQAAQKRDPAAPAAAAEREFTARACEEGIYLSAKEPESVEVAILGVLDRSGSMAEPSARPGGGAVAEAALFSRMDVTQHSAITVANLLHSKKAAFGLVSFSDAATVDMPLRKMDDAGLAEAEKKIRGLRPGGGTNIWAGLRQAITQAISYSEANPLTNIHIILLTDGEPTASYNPLQGIVGALKKKLSTLKTQVTVSSFGFGYNLDALLLEQICTEGGGTYGYIPDCSLAGSVFINYCANALSTTAAQVRIETPAGETTLVRNLQSGIARFVPLKGVRAGEQLAIHYGPGEGKASAVAGTATTDEADNAKVCARLLADLGAATRSSNYDSIDWSGLAGMADWMGDPDGAFRSAVRQDLQHTADDKGQLLKAVSKREWFNSWGINHLISYKRAIACGHCANFKDAALQYFAGDAFKAIQAAGNDIFDNLPAPTPSLSSSYGYYGGGGGAGAAGAPATMATLNMANSGCFAGHCMVEMADNTRRYVAQLRAGDIVRGGFRILCVVRTTLAARPRMVRLPGLDITPWHPIRTEAAWKFPCEMGEPVETPINTYYNLVLEGGHYVRIGAYDVCTLGHGFTDNYVIRHPYFGTQAVIDDLRQLNGWQNGLVELRPEDVRRCPRTGLINGVTPAALAPNCPVGVPNQI
jgi:hypothetical protein